MSDAKLPVTKKLTITAGCAGTGSGTRSLRIPTLRSRQTTYIPNDLSQWQPRLGIAWNPASNTVVRLSSGLYDAPTPADIFQRVFTDNAINTVVADSYFDPADSAAGLFRRELHFVERAARRVDDSRCVGRWHRARLSAIRGPFR